MIRELGNVGLFELCEIVPKVQCLHCLLHWNQPIVYCTCGQLLVDSESRRKFHKQRLVAFSIPNYVIKKGRSHGARHGKTEEQKEYHVDWNAWKGCFKKVDSQGGHCTGIHDRFLRDPRLSRITIRIRMDRRKVPRSGRTCKTKTHILSLYRGISKDTKENGISPWISQSKMGRCDFDLHFRAADTLKKRFHRESGVQVAEPISPQQYRRWHSSSSDSWWDTSEKSWWSSKEIFKWPFLLQLVSFTVDGDHL